MKKNKKKTILGTIIVVLTMAMGVNGCSNAGTSNTSNQKVEVKKVGTKRLEKADDKKKTLAKEKKDREQEYQKLKDQLADQKEKEAEKKAEEQKQAKEQKENEEKEEAKAKKVQEAQEQVHESNTATSTPSTVSGSNSGGNHGDMNTAATGQIVGNARSHIYHVPGQAGYRMNSSNAVYFNSEQDAINAGYRKALR